jgi:hypothetical protein
MRLATGHFRMRTSSSALDPRVLLAADAWIARRASHDLSRCLRTGRLHELWRAPCSPEAGWTNRHRHVSAADPTRPLPFQEALMTVAATLVLAAGRDGLRDQSLRSRPAAAADQEQVAVSRAGELPDPRHLFLHIEGDSPKDGSHDGSCL